MTSVVSSAGTMDFYPRSPCGERPHIHAPSHNPCLHFYPRSPCGERRWELGKSNGMQAFLSTLSLRRATPVCPASVLTGTKFLSTLSLRRATHCVVVGVSYNGYFYPRSPCGERRAPPRSKTSASLFLSTLSLRRATNAKAHRAAYAVFLSTLSLRRATQRPKRSGQCAGISIHALLAESDKPCLLPCPAATYFYPRSPCGERRIGLRCVGVFLGISIHALLAESDFSPTLTGSTGG